MNEYFNIYFVGNEITETVFNHPLCSTQLHCVRGKGGGAYGAVGSFQWTPAVQGLALLLVHARRSWQAEGRGAPIKGLKGSPAAALDYAIDKVPVWMVDMLGSDAHGRSLIHRLIHRTNANRKRPGPVVLGINERFMNCGKITIYCDDKIADASQLEALEMELQLAWEKRVRACEEKLELAA